VIDSRQVNILFAGQDNGVEDSTPGSTWDNMTVSKNKCSVATFRRASVYNPQRGVYPYPIKTERGTITGWLCFTSSTNIMHLREDEEYERWSRDSVVIGPNQDVFEPQEYPVLYNHVLIPYEHIEEGLTGNTHLFGEENDATTPTFYKRASIILGRQAVTVSEYDGDVKANPMNEDEGGRSPKIGIDMIMGMRANEKVTKDDLPRDHGITVLCHCDEIVG